MFVNKVGVWEKKRDVEACAAHLLSAVLLQAVQEATRVSQPERHVLKVVSFSLTKGGRNV